MHLTLITGLSGSGKSVALRALEDVGHYCVDNLPPELLPRLVDLQRAQGVRRLAVAIDARSGQGLADLPQQLASCQADSAQVRQIFLDASLETLVRRFSETRRRHPLSRPLADERRALIEAIELERQWLAPLREQAHVIDTSLIRAAQLQDNVLALVNASAGPMTLVFESFGFKRGLPIDADYVFDVRMLPNPYWEPALRPLTGLDAPVQEFLALSADVGDMLEHIDTFLNRWLSPLTRDHRSYVTVALGCTGGQHRSVYLVEQLAQRQRQRGVQSVLCRHRELTPKATATHPAPDDASRTAG